MLGPHSFTTFDPMNTLKLVIDYDGHDIERDMLVFIARGPGYSKQFECKPENMDETIAVEIKELYSRYNVDPAGGMQVNIVEVEE